MNQRLGETPERPVDALTARRSLFAEHERLRAQLEQACVIADGALDQRPDLPSDAVACAIGDLHACFEAHLVIEEQVLVAIFDEDRLLAAENAERLRHDHERQRAKVATLDEEAHAAPERPLLAAKLAFLAAWLIDDMVDEERHLRV
jgi:hypothetical protein